ncbi:MAG: phage-shock protein [Bacillota bacterium]
MNGNLHSLTDVLKRTLFFFETLPAKELAPYVRRKMLKDQSLAQVEEKVELCLKQHSCFVPTGDGQWRLDLKGDRENDHFYHMLLKRQEPLSLWEVIKSSQSKKKKLRRLIAEEANLISDGRFVQLTNGTWGLTEWDLDAGGYPLKHLVIKAFRLHPGGLTLAQVVSVVNNWRETGEKSVEAILEKFPYFEKRGDSLWVYNSKAHQVYDAVTKKYLNILKEQKRRKQQEREQWQKKVKHLKTQMDELAASQKEVATAMAAHTLVREQYEHLANQVSEKDLLLSLRKKEILYYQQQVRKLEAKAASILHQCRLWVQRARQAQEENNSLRESLAAAQENLEGMFAKLQQYKEKYRESQASLAEVKEAHATRVAELQSEIIDLRERVEKLRQGQSKRERYLEEEVERLQSDLKDALEAGEDLQRSIRFMQQEMAKMREEYRRMERRLKGWLVRLAVRISSIFGR